MRWDDYTPEQRERAQHIKRGQLATRGVMTDAQASQAVDGYPVMQYKGTAIPAYTIINWEGALKRNIVTLWDREDNDPAHVPDRWEDIAYRKGARIIPDTINPPGWALDELGYWHGSAAAVAGVYRSGMHGNVHVPGTQGAPWTLVEAD